MTIGFWQGLNEEQLARVARYHSRQEALESALTSLLASLAAYPTFPDSPLTLAMDRARKVLREGQNG